MNLAKGSRADFRVHGRCNSRMVSHNIAMLTGIW